MALTIEKLCTYVDALELVAGDGGETVRCVCAVEGMRSAALAERDCLVLPLCSDEVQLAELLRGLSVSAVLLEQTYINDELLALCRRQKMAVLRYSGTAEEIEQKCRFWLEEEAQQESFAVLIVQAAMSFPVNSKIYQTLQHMYPMEQLCLTGVELRSADGRQLPQLRCSELLQQLRYETRRSEVPIIWLRKDNIIYGLFGCPDEQARSIVEKIVHGAPEEQFRIAVSRTVQSPEELPTLSRHVRLMLKLLWSDQTIGTVCSYRDLGMYQILLSIDDPEAMRQLYEKTLAPLVRYDEENGTDYVGLLQCYLRHDAGVSATAAALFLHRNSVNYKLNRIQEILGCSLSRQTVRSQLLVAFMIRDLL